MTFNELLLEAIKCDDELLAYSIYWLIKNNVVKGTDRANNINWNLVHHEEVKQMRERNELNLQTIKTYSVPLGNRQHIIIFAQSEESAKGHVYAELGRIPTKIFDISNKMDMSFWFPEQQKNKSLRQVKDETLVFPATAMIFTKG
ncbi:hypothetical protein MPH48_03360 [Lysinibacillus fusiformis]|uniref:hypothetical protein n=1 Tax=Lysinibacillus fusiformis TaxID=28031 RepID=UPI001F4E294B|nr:hypothetical protein [Lysinibacillus fusiformis]MCK1987136.1 hypothetical protein [Lysinibacillus fusiformis]